MSQNTIPKPINSKKKVGWIEFDPNIDRDNFHICDEKNIMEYYQVNCKYKEGNKSIKSYLLPYFNTLNELISDDGYLTIRFVVNCKGETDRFRTYFVDQKYQNIKVPRALEKVLTSTVKKMGDWTPGFYKDKHYDCYTFITLKIVNKKIVDVLP